jgi:hypothetical protein
MTLVAFADAHRVQRTASAMPHVAVRATLGYTGIIGKTGCSRSSAWIWLTWGFAGQDVQIGLHRNLFSLIGIQGLSPFA